MLEEEIADMRDRIRQFENVMTTAFGLIQNRGSCDNGGTRRQSAEGNH